MPAGTKRTHSQSSGQQSKRTKASVERLIKDSGEKKGMDTILDLDPVLATTNTNGSSFTLNLVEPGNGSYNRVGRKIYNKSARLTGLFQCQQDTNASTQDVGQNIRMVVVWDKQPSGTLPTWDAIFGITTQDGTEQSSVFAPPRYDNMARFQVLRDKIITMNPMNPNPTNGTFYKYHFDEYIKLGNRTTVYSGQSSPCTIADISSGALYVYFRSELNTALTNEMNLTNSHCRFRYSD